MSQSTASTVGMGLHGWTFIVFLVFKLLGKITWSWWLVTAPLWLPVCFFAGIMFGVVILAIVARFVKPKPSWMR